MCQKARKCSKNDENNSKGHKSQLVISSPAKSVTNGVSKQIIIGKDYHPRGAGGWVGIHVNANISKCEWVQALNQELATCAQLDLRIAMN